VGWEPGDTKVVRLVRYAGARGRGADLDGSR
jgi:urease beta subunit